MKNEKFKRYLFNFLTVVIISALYIIPTLINVSEAISIIDRGSATIDGVSVRSTNSSSGKYLGSLRTGDKVEILEKTNNGWYKIKYKDSYAYVSNEFIRLKGTKTVDNVLNTGVVYNANKLTVREFNSESSKVLGYLPKDTKVEIVRVTSTNWYKIKYENSYAYVKGRYINLTKSNNKTSNKDSSKSSDIDNLNNFLFVGDSFTARMENTIKSNNDSIYVSAQGGSRSWYWLDKVDDMPDKDDVDSICLLIGVNGITESKNIIYTKALINQLIVKYPDKTIYVQKVFPVGENFVDGDPVVYNNKIKEYNEELVKFCKTKSNINIIDTTKGFVNDKGYLINTSDGLHIDKSKEDKYYKNIFNAIKLNQN